MSLLQVNALQSTDSNSIVVRSNLLLEAGRTIGYGASDIGIAGTFGFGQSPYPYAVPQDFSPMTGTYDVFHENYGSYLYVDGSVMIYIPRFYYRIGHTHSPHYSIFGDNAIDIAGDFTFSSESEANLAGYALHRAFYDGGIIKQGFFVDKFHWSNNGGKASSIKNRDPISCHPGNNPFSNLLGSPQNNYAGAFAAAKTRGGHYSNSFFPLFRHHFAALAMLSQAHAQAVAINNTTTACAWYSSNSNFPKGNNYYLRDYDDTAVVFTASEFIANGPSKTGSGTPFAKTTHNGQNCGVADLNGNMWHVTPGITSDGTLLYLLKETVACKDLIADTAFTYNSDVFYSHTYGTDTGVLAGTNQFMRFGNANNAVLAANTDRTTSTWRLTGMGIPQADGASEAGSNHFGLDGIWDYKPSGMCPVSGGDWDNGAYAGAWALNLYLGRSASSYAVGGRSGLYL